MLQTPFVDLFWSNREFPMETVFWEQYGLLIKTRSCALIERIGCYPDQVVSRHEGPLCALLKIYAEKPESERSNYVLRLSEGPWLTGEDIEALAVDAALR